MADKPVYIPVATLQGFMRDVFLGLGVPPEDAAITAEVLITSDLWGIASHGVGRLKQYYDRIKGGLQHPVTQMRVLKETPTTAVIDGQLGMGQVVAHRSMRMAIDKARRYGMGAVAVRNSGHFGIAGYYPLMAVKEGMVGLTVTNARPSIAPTFGVQPKLGTNPIAFGAPSDEPHPFLYDAATSITQRGKIEVLDRAEEPTPAGWVIGADGTTATDSAQILRDLTTDSAALLPLGGAGEEMAGHKGYGLATMVEVLSASLQGGLFLSAVTDIDRQGRPQPLRIGHFFLAIDVEHCVPLAEFKKTTGDIMRELRASKRAPGCERIYTAGEKEYANEQRVRAEGVPANANLQKVIKTMQQELGLTRYDLGF
ncbi:MAG TPA: Ldh family oxidoreductase [Anaerolineae bacterium]|nr:Ldh family oxidoreductase [Anaerolineae bacterium]HOR00634.1 Ldh family oxidoreductase [Anaerolineae bacterium]HPL29697.1 Ldh family oxidoreductase [Anaerolineae bacterium]